MRIELKNIHAGERVFIVVSACPIGPITTVESDSQAWRMEDVKVTI